MASRKWRDELLPNVVDHIADQDPGALYAEYPVSTLTYDEGYRRITYRDFANAIDKVAWWLHESLGPSKDCEVLAYIGPNDLRYPVLILGAVKAGYVLFLTSPRNSVAAQLNLLERLNCKTILSPKPHPPQITAILEASEKFRVLGVPSVDDLLDKKSPRYSFVKSFTEARQDPLFIVHTSGSTGFPKPITFNHDAATKSMTMVSLDPPLGFESLDRLIQGKRVVITFPPFHGAYLASHFFNAVPFGTVIISPTSGAIPTAESLVEGLKKTPADILFIVPSIVDELSRKPELLAYCAENLEMIVYCGGDLPQVIGDIVASKVRLVNQFGATELGLSPMVLQKEDDGRLDWKYTYFHPALGAEFRPLIDNTHELYIVQKPELEQQQPTFALFPHLQEYASRDLFIQHPSKDKPYLWRWQARADDIIVFLNGEKTNPISMEQHIAARNSDVRAALVMGAQRFQAALLIDPVSEDAGLSMVERAAFIEKIWPSVEEANRECPAHAKIAKTHIFFTDPKKRMLIAGKGTVQRAGTLELYKQELDALYAAADSIAASEEGDNLGDVNIESASDVAVFLRRVILTTTSWLNIEDSDDFFALGMDSLQALTIVRKLRRGLGKLGLALSTSTIYTNPSIAQLSNAVMRLCKHQESNEIDRIREQVGLSMLAQLKTRIDSMSSATRQSKKYSRNKVIILTGSTGALGTYILESLLSDAGITHIYCLNRPVPGGVPRKRGKLADNIPEDRVTFLTADLSKPLLDLHPSAYSKLLETTTHIIHNAWPVNFNLSLQSFRPSLEGLVNLIELTTSTLTGAKLFFISSISSVMSYQTPSGYTPEEVVSPLTSPNSSVAGPNGYAESKLLSELLLSHASEQFSSKGCEFAFARVGQIAGPVKQKGIWNKTEWFPSLVLSSIHIGAIPESLGATFGRIDWVPIDLLADIIVQLALNNDQHDEGIQVFHPLNPEPSTWEKIRLDLVADISAVSGKKIDLIPLETWIGRVKNDMETKAGPGTVLKEGDLEKILKVNPAIKLLEFYEDVLGGEGQRNILETKKAEGLSEKLRALDGVEREWMKKWLDEWCGE